MDSDGNQLISRDSAWRKWPGGDCPVDLGVHVEVLFAGGMTNRDIAGVFHWPRMGRSSDIVAYRMVLPFGKTEPAAPPLPEPALPSGHKPTNPKDAVGVRKAPLSCVPMNVVAEIGVGMLEGTVKYGRHNYRAMGVRSSVYFDAAMRHLIAWWEGEDLDPDSGMSHVAKALTTLTVLRDAQMQGKCTDDRPPHAAPFYADLNARAGAILDRHADKSPHHYTQGEV